MCSLTVPPKLARVNAVGRLRLLVVIAEHSVEGKAENAENHQSNSSSAVLKSKQGNNVLHLSSLPKCCSAANKPTLGPLFWTLLQLCSLLAFYMVILELIPPQQSQGIVGDELQHAPPTHTHNFCDARD